MKFRMLSTIRDRQFCLGAYGGYTEISGKRFHILDTAIIEENQYFKGKWILFSYEYMNNSAETGFTLPLVIEALMKNIVGDYTYTNIYGGYRSGNSLIEEKGLALFFDNTLTDLDLGVLAHRIAFLFRQECVLAIIDSEVTYVYA